MKILLDTSTVLWWYENDRRITGRVGRAIDDRQNEVFVSAASVWEIAIKTATGKLNAQALLDSCEARFAGAGFRILEIRLGDAVRASGLPRHHKDPFDRMLVAQAQAENLAIMSNDAVFDHYGVRRVW